MKLKKSYFSSKSHDCEDIANELSVGSLKPESGLKYPDRHLHKVRLSHHAIWLWHEPIWSQKTMLDTPQVLRNVRNTFPESSEVYPTLGMLRSLQINDFIFGEGGGADDHLPPLVKMSV